MRRLDVRLPMRPCRRVAALVLVLASLVPARGFAAGPLFVNDAGTPLVWETRPVPWNSDLGTLGVLDQASAHQLVDDAFAVWAAVPTAAITFADAGALSADVTAANVGLFVGVCGDGRSPIVFDTDGTITDALFGAGASNSILGFAGPECGTFVPPVITEASAVLNGKFIDGVASGGNPEVELETFFGVLVHEFGHYVNLDHSQINLLEAFDGQTLNDDTIATMFPFVVSGPETATLTRDDAVSLSMLYPADDFAAVTGAITGTIRRGDTNALHRRLVSRGTSTIPAATPSATSRRALRRRQHAPAAAALAGAYELPASRRMRRTPSSRGGVAALHGRVVGRPLSPPATLPARPSSGAATPKPGRARPTTRTRRACRSRSRPARSPPGSTWC
jgi:hypothetical protein